MVAAGTLVSGLGCMDMLTSYTSKNIEPIVPEIEFRQKVGQNPCGELPLGRNFVCENTRDYPREP
jgi:hypothetical protein